MSRTFAAVLGITLGLPILAMIALTATGGVKPDFLMTFLVGGVLMVFAVGAVFEVKRLVDLDGHEHSAHAEIVSAAPTSEPNVYDTPSLSVSSNAEGSAEILAPKASADNTEVLVPSDSAGGSDAVDSAAPPAVAVEPVILQNEPPPPVTKEKRKGGCRKGANAA